MKTLITAAVISLALLTHKPVQAQNPLVRLAEFQVSHFKQFGRFSGSSSQMQRFSQINSHLLAPNVQPNAVIVQLIPQNSNGRTYSVAVLHTRNTFLTVGCEARQSGRNLLPNPRATNNGLLCPANSQQVFAMQYN